MTGTKEKWDELSWQVKKLGLSMDFVLRRVGISRQSRNNYLKGKYYPSPRNARVIEEKISQIYGLRRGKTKVLSLRKIILTDIDISEASSKSLNIS